MMSNILYNCIRTPDGTLLPSRSVHDYVTHVDKNGDTYTNDGGNEYLHRSVNIIPAEDLTIYDTDPHEKIREAFYWGSYGKVPDYSKDPVYRPLKDLADDHIKAIIATQNHLPEWRMNVFKEELIFRGFNNLFVGE